jgi:predicted Zn-dependent protease
MMAQQSATGATPKRHGLTSSEARELCDRVLRFSKAENARVNITSGIEAFTRTAANRVTTAGVTDNITVQITSAFGKRVASIDTNKLDDASLERAVRESETMAQISPENPQYLPELGPQTFTEVDGYYDSTGTLTTESRAQAATLGIKAAEAAKCVASGYIEVRAGSRAIATSKGLFGYYPTTGVSSTLTVRTTDGVSSGWAGGEGADWRTLESERIAGDAVRKCQAWRGKTSLEPGKYMAVLEPVAAGMLIGLAGGAFDARSADEGRSFFSKPGGGNRVGEKLFDSRVTLISDPAEKNAEASPFNNGGLPIRREVWVENGGLKALAYNRFWAARQSVAPRSAPNNLRMSGGDASVEDMIKSVSRGVLITRFFYIRGTNPRSIAFTGVTRDGTFLIENGKVTRPVNNFRFNQSITEMLSKIEALGRPMRVAGESGNVGSGLVVPPMLVRDFNLTSISDAV